MKKKLIVLFALLTVALLCFAACSTPSVSDLQKINDLLKLDYSKITVVVNTKTATAEFNGNFVFIFNGEDTTVQYKYDLFNAFDVDDNGNIADNDGEYVIHKEGEVVVRDGEIVDGDEDLESMLVELRITGFSFKQAYFSNATLKNAKFEANVINPQKFTGNDDLTCSDMHVVVIRNISANKLTSIELTYKSENGADVKIDYLFQ